MGGKTAQNMYSADNNKEQYITLCYATDLGRPYWIYIIHDPWHAPVAVTTVFSTPEDGRGKPPKRVE